MDSGRRQFIGRFAAALTGVAVPFPVPDGPLPEGHDRFMRLAVAEARKNPQWPFGAVIVHARTGEILGSGVNTGDVSPVLHGEMVAMNDYVSRQGNQGWSDTTLYTTAEPCSMCMSAMAWANLRRVVWGSSIDEIRRTGVIQIDLTARQVAASASSFYSPELLLGGVLAQHTNRLFEEAQRLRRESARPEVRAGAAGL
ncbi:nucleoside deaminase [Streptomyces sp. NPDC098781]|uniref:nucleoside deaminase n=1 Tax=Streptomyces sp. NPDC098781 TaxID=3366097 RepID=UPI003829765E